MKAPRFGSGWIVGRQANGATAGLICYARRTRDQRTSALYRLRLLILRLHEKWEQHTLDQRQPDVPATNNGAERSIGRWRIRSHATRGFKSWAGLEAAFLLCSDPIA